MNNPRQAKRQDHITKEQKKKTNWQQKDPPVIQRLQSSDNVFKITQLFKSSWVT